MSERGARTGSLALLRNNKQLRWLFIAQIISYAGDWFAYVALAGQIHDLTGSSVLVSLVSVLEALPTFLLAPLAGPIVDRFDRRRIIMFVSFGQAVAAASMVFVRSSSTVPIGFVAVAVIAGLAAFVGPATQAAIPNLARSADEMQSATVLFGSTWGVMLAVGSALGGVVASAFGRNAAFLTNAGSFLLAAGFIGLVSVAMQGERANTSRRVRPIADMAEAARFARRDHVTLALLSFKMTAGIGAGIVSLLVVFARDNLNGGDAASGLLMGARGVGAVLGPIIAMRFIKRDTSRLLTVCGMSGLVFAVGYLLLSASNVLVLGLVAVMVAHLGGGANWALSTYGLQLRSPDEIRGRILAGDFAIVTLVLSISGIAAGLIDQATGNLRATMVGFSLLAAVSAVANLAATRSLRRRLRAEDGANRIGE